MADAAGQWHALSVLLWPTLQAGLGQDGFDQWGVFASGKTTTRTSVVINCPASGTLFKSVAVVCEVLMTATHLAGQWHDVALSG